jgi:hypothetical protein
MIQYNQIFLGDLSSYPMKNGSYCEPHNFFNDFIDCILLCILDYLYYNRQHNTF